MKHLIMGIAVLLSGCSRLHERGSGLSTKDCGRLRSLPVLAVDREAIQYVEQSGFWEMSQFRQYAQDELDRDEVDDAVMLTTYESGQFYKRVMFVALSSLPGHVSTVELGGKGERMASKVKIEGRKILVEGMRYAPNDGMCCPSLPFAEVYEIHKGSVRLIDREAPTTPTVQ